MDALTEERALTFPTRSTAWRLDHRRAAWLARWEFDVRCPVEFTHRRSRARTRRLPAWAGWHVWRPGGHQVHALIFRAQTMQEYLEVFAHELRHAWQAEQYGTPADWAWTLNHFSDPTATLSQLAGSQREDNPFEHDADLAAERTWPLLLPSIRLTRGDQR